MSNQNVITIAATVYWACFDHLNEYTNKYQVDLANLSDKAVDALEGLGIAVNNKGDDRGNFITTKSNNVIRPDFSCDVVPLNAVGNGSTATAAISFYDWEWKGKKGRSPSLKKLLINEVQVYSPDGAVADDLDLSNAL